MFIIRKAKVEDAQAVLDIRNAAILDQCVGHYPPDILKVWTGGELSETFIGNVERYVYVTTYNDQVIASSMLNIEAARIDAVFVLPNYMGKGVGRNLIKFLEGLALSQGLVTLKLESTLNAAGFYRACGFEGAKVDTYVSPKGISLDCIPMMKVISKASGDPL